ncbi:MAG: flagellar hook-associated protein FlgK [Woeseia sp.]|nr:flagellar hook-associated protein FlgK [Woeseia sp.]MBT8097933.1 flagellar hook-associated protein FlgK [Woeseia sp.]NNE60047.1 flagellar hook-associated protein FlgK [Woeseia sp.]NNL55516.1 flagellar hook-associated protein FlgK [Woeseia sp.]
MANLLSTSLSGMLAFQRALETTGNNIANVNTPGYSRQVAEFSTRPGQQTGAGYFGGGTQISTIRRVYDELLGAQVQSSTTSHARFEAMNDLALRLDTLLADPSTGLNSQLQSFFNGVQDIANDPASIPTRQALLGEADGLVLRFSEIDRQLRDLDAELNQRVAAAVSEINQITSSIATLNTQITVGQSTAGQPPNDLLDQRDLLVRDLAALVSVDTTIQDNGAMNVFVSNGQSLVIGNDSFQLGTRSSEFDASRLEVTFEGPAGSTPLGNSISGGMLGGLSEFRMQVLDPARKALGETAQAMALTFNEQHASGLDLYGNLGGDFFAIDPPEVMVSSGNSGSGTASATISDLASLTGTEYVLAYDGAAYSLTRADNGQAVALTGTGSGADPFVAEGLSIVTGGSPAAGDRLLIRPTIGGAAGISRAITDPQSLAMAAPTRTTASLDNIGSGTISPSAVVDRADAGLLTSSVIEFTGASTYSINGAGTFSYASGDAITINGSEFTISGEPSIGDQFTIEANSAASGDNRNGLQLANLQAVGILDGGTISINESYGQLVTNVGSTTRQVKANLEAQSVVLANAENAQLAKSGVNLDEEAANLLRFQQSYQAVAQVISIASEMFDTLLNATRR